MSRDTNTVRIAEELTAEFIARQETSPQLTIAQFFVEKGALGVLEKEVELGDRTEPYVQATYLNHYALYAYPAWGETQINCKHY